MDIADSIFRGEGFKVLYQAAAQDIQLVTDFWNHYNRHPDQLLNTGQAVVLREKMFGLLRACKQIDPVAFTKIHKGHPYYFIAIASYLMHDYQTAVYFFDASVSEDIDKAKADPLNDKKPSTHFLMLEGDEPNQAAQELTKQAQHIVEAGIGFYWRLVSNSHLNLQDLRKDFIAPVLTSNNPQLRTLVTSLITFCLEWNFRKQFFDYGIPPGSQEPFFTHLFRGCLLFESLLKHNRTLLPQGSTLGNILQELSPNLGIEFKAKNASWGDVLSNLSSIAQPLSISSAINITYMTRNTLGHDLGWEDRINQEQYTQLYKIILAACLHVIACLWMPASSAEV